MKYFVQIEYHSTITKMVDADSEEEATIKARDNTDGDDLLRKAQIWEEECQLIN